MWERFDKREVGYLYLMKCGEFHKIGISNNTFKRRKTLQTATPYDVTLECSGFTTRLWQREEYLHKKYQAKWHRGEWFRLDEKEVDEVKFYIWQAEKESKSSF